MDDIFIDTNNCTPTKQRLQKYMATSGVASRRKCERLIVEGHVSVNGHVVTELGTKVSCDDIVLVDGVRCVNERLLYFVLNKPRGYICTVHDDYGRKTIYDLIDNKTKLFSIGRLDLDSEGLIIVTNDGDFANSVMHPRYNMTKQYRVISEQNVPDELVYSFVKGVYIENVMYKAIEIQRSNKRNELFITLGEGKNREIRNVYKYFGLNIKILQRVKIGNMSLAELGLKKGQYKEILLENLKKMVF